LALNDVSHEADSGSGFGGSGFGGSGGSGFGGGWFFMLGYDCQGHRLWSITRQQANRMSGSPIAAKPRVGEVRNRVETSLSPTRAGRDATKWRL